MSEAEISLSKKVNVSITCEVNVELELICSLTEFSLSPILIRSSHPSLLKSPVAILVTRLLPERITFSSEKFRCYFILDICRFCCGV